MSKTNVATYHEKVLQTSAQNGQTYTAMRVEEMDISKQEACDLICKELGL
jgi:hypothetical protein